MSVPEDILQIVRRVKPAWVSSDDLPAKWLLASEIHLNGADESDFIVMGIGGLRLPHAALFRVFRQTPQGHQLILSTGGDALKVLNARSKGYRAIRVYNNTASTTTTAIYRFDGHRYQLASEKTKPIR